VSDVDYTLDIASLERLFLTWAFGLSDDDAAADASAADAAFAHLQMVAQRFDVRRMPRLPALVPQLMAAMRRDDADAGEIAGLLSRDPTLAGDVMRVACSAYYALAQPPSGLRQAVQRIGHDGLRQVVLATVMRPILRGDAGLPGHAMASRLWSQAEARAWLCGRLAPGLADPAEAQLAGIVAGTGVAALSRMVHPSMLADAAADPSFAARFLELARPVSVRAATHWHMPATVLDALENADCTPLGRVLAAGDRLAMGYRLIESGRLAGDASWPTGIASHDAPDRRAALYVAMSHEVEPLEPEPAAA
jgi:HD-like signal output (HDOD) protein